jgi:hypothetical protein
MPHSDLEARCHDTAPSIAGTLYGREMLAAQAPEGISATLAVAAKEQEAEVAEAEVADMANIVTHAAALARRHR